MLEYTLNLGVTMSQNSVCTFFYGYWKIIDNVLWSKFSCSYFTMHITFFSDK